MLYALLFFIVLIFTSLPRRKSLLSVLARTKTPAAISQDCRLAVYTEKSIAQFLHIMLLSPVFLSCFLHRYRAENLCYQFTHGQKLLPQFRKIVGLLFRLLLPQLFIVNYSLKKHASKRAFYCCDVFYFSSNFALSFAKYSVI